MRALPAITGAVLMVVLSACGQAADQGSAAGQPSPSSTSSGPPPPSTPSTPGSTPAPPATGQPQGAGPLPGDQVDTSSLPSYYTERKVWILNEGRTLQLTAMARDACVGVTARVIEQNDKIVRVMISPMDVPQGGSADAPPICAQVITPRVVTVDLKAPLGTRKVIVSAEV
jgi:hypothetical protein